MFLTHAHVAKMDKDFEEKELESEDKRLLETQIAALQKLGWRSMGVRHSSEGVHYARLVRLSRQEQAAA